MGQCGEIVEPGIECNEPTVLWGHCEAHLTPRERAVWMLVQEVWKAVYFIEENEGPYFLDDVIRAIAAVKDQV